jgi:hypothetical protein
VVGGCTPTLDFIKPTLEFVNPTLDFLDFVDLLFFSGLLLGGGHGRVAGPSVDGLDLGLAAKEVAAQAELRTKRKRYDEEQAAIKRRYDEETAANEQRWKEDEAGSSRKLQKIRDLRKDAEDLAAEQLARAAQLVARAAEL